MSALIFMPQYVMNTNLLCYCSTNASEFKKCLTVSDKFNLHHIKGKYFKLNKQTNKQTKKKEKKKKKKKKQQVVADFLRPKTIIFVGI